ncbi:MAG: SDR family oxidoreductase [Verrucomicrobiae bacterium]|nr:SDR family oxidoreductase [Verrucomicrobiae bacterium]
MNLGLTDKRVLLTGASRGIGRAIARALAEEGAVIFGVARNRADLERAMSVLPQGLARHGMGVLDLGEPGACEALHQQMVDQMGVPDIIVHNVGGSLGVTSSLAPLSDWQKVWRLNVGIAIELNNLFLPAMIEKRWGRVVHLSTISTQSFHGNPAYVSAKCALNGYVKSVGRSVAKDNVVLSALMPGPVRIEGRYFALLERENPVAMEEYMRHHQSSGRLGAPEEIASVVLFLCSEQASFTNACIFPVDGGNM